jgi:hypothetical protein
MGAPSKPNNGNVTQAGQKPPSNSVTPYKPAWEILLDQWDATYGPSPRPKWVVDEAKEIVSRLKGNFEKVKSVYEAIQREGKNKGKPITLEMVYNNWNILDKPAKSPPPTTAKPASGRRNFTQERIAREKALAQQGGTH